MKYAIPVFVALLLAPLCDSPEALWWRELGGFLEQIEIFPNKQWPNGVLYT